MLLAHLNVLILWLGVVEVNFLHNRGDAVGNVLDAFRKQRRIVLDVTDVLFAERQQVDGDILDVDIVDIGDVRGVMAVICSVVAVIRSVVQDNRSVAMDISYVSLETLFVGEGFVT